MLSYFLNHFVVSVSGTQVTPTGTPASILSLKRDSLKREESEPTKPKQRSIWTLFTNNDHLSLHDRHRLSTLLDKYAWRVSLGVNTLGHIAFVIYYYVRCNEIKSQQVIECTPI